MEAMNIRRKCSKENLKGLQGADNLLRNEDLEPDRRAQ